jgi:hypothetical protein
MAAVSVINNLQCIMPCICELLGTNSPLVHCIRAYQQYCTIVGLKVMTTSRIERLKAYVETYEKYCAVCPHYIR